MSLSILTNISAMQTHQNLLASSDAVAMSQERLSSGLRINTAADDAAGYAISQGLTSQVNGLDQASRNVGDAVSMVQTAESSMNNVQSMLQRVRELAVQYQNGSLQAADKTAIQGEVNQLTSEIDRQRTAVSFNGRNLLDGSASTGGAGVTFQVGANATDTLSASFADIRGSMTAAAGFTWANAGSGNVLDLGVLVASALSDLDTAITGVSSAAATLGAPCARTSDRARPLAPPPTCKSIRLRPVQTRRKASRARSHRAQSMRE